MIPLLIEKIVEIYGMLMNYIQVISVDSHPRIGSSEYTEIED